MMVSIPNLMNLWNSFELKPQTPVILSMEPHLLHHVSLARALQFRIMWVRSRRNLQMPRRRLVPPGHLLLNQLCNKNSALCVHKCIMYCNVMRLNRCPLERDFRQPKRNGYVMYVWHQGISHGTALRTPFVRYRSAAKGTRSLSMLIM